jgi:hypothetical protein
MMARALAFWLASMLVLVPSLLGQAGPRRGVELGLVSAKHTGTEFETSSYEGFTVGAFVEVDGPVNGMAVRVSGRWVRRGSHYSPLDDRTTASRVRTDHLGMALLLSPRVAVGHAVVFLLAGPSVEYSVASRADALFDERYPDSVPIGLTVLGGGGLAADLGQRGRVSAELRWGAGLRPAFRGPGPDPDSRSVEWVVAWSR